MAIPGLWRFFFSSRRRNTRCYRDWSSDVCSSDLGDVDKQLEHVHKDVVVTWQNGEVVRGLDGLREFYKKNVAQQKVFQGYKEPPTPADLTILHGSDTGDRKSVV